MRLLFAIQLLATDFKRYIERWIEKFLGNHQCCTEYFQMTLYAKKMRLNVSHTQKISIDSGMIIWMIDKQQKKEEEEETR